LNVNLDSTTPPLANSSSHCASGSTFNSYLGSTSFYESRLAKLDVNQEKIDTPNARIGEVIEDEGKVVPREGNKE